MRNTSVTAIAAVAVVGFGMLAVTDSAYALKEGVKHCCNVKTGQHCVTQPKPFPCGNPNYHPPGVDCSKVKAKVVCTDTYKKVCPCPDNG
jgi:hypothetical protein